MQLAYQQLHAVPYREVNVCWRRLYTDAALHQTLQIVEGFIGKGGEGDAVNDGVLGNGEDWVGKVVKLLDMTLILTGAVGREE